MDSSLLKIAGNIASVDIYSVRKNKSKKKKAAPKKVKRKDKRSTKKVSAPVDEMSFEDISLPQTEYSASMEVSLSVNFEGHADKAHLMAKFKEEIISSIENGVSVTAKSFQLIPSQLRVKPLKVNFVVNDAASLDDFDL